jgi:sigma-E factor negative regulatory protein RseB
MRFPTPSVLLLSALAASTVAYSTAVAGERPDPGDWLNRMAAAVQQTSYSGTVIRINDGEAEALKVVHTVSDGVIREKVVAQEGTGLEIIRNGNEVHCILPDRKSVLVEEWDDQSTLFSTLPTSKVRFGSEYDVVLMREDRVAGRRTILVAIRPHDEYRYGHRIWLDLETAFPLQAQLIGGDGEPIEQVKFVDISLNTPIDLDMLAPSIDIAAFRWVNQPPRHVSRNIETSWASNELPRGFRAISTHAEKLPGSDEMTTHILYSDGLANVSVFIVEAESGAADGTSNVGGSNSYSTIVDGYRVTAVGEVPAMTVRQIATTMTSR